METNNQLGVVHAFTMVDPISGQPRRTLFLATRETIRMLGGEVIPGTGRTVHHGEIDANGVYVGDPSRVWPHCDDGSAARD
jgi:hypothetical protein